MFRYNFKLRLLVGLSVIVICAAMFLVWVWHYKPMNLPNDGQLTLVDGENIIINDNGYSLDLDTFSRIGETQKCVFVFENQNSAQSHTYVTATYNKQYFDFDYEETFTIDSNKQTEFVVYITLINYPNTDDGLPLSIDFNTSYM